MQNSAQLNLSRRYLKCRLKLSAIGERTGMSPLGYWVVSEAPRRRYRLRAESMFRYPVPAQGAGRVDELPVHTGRGKFVQLYGKAFHGTLGEALLRYTVGPQPEPEGGELGFFVPVSIWRRDAERVEDSAAFQADSYEATDERWVGNHVDGAHNRGLVGRGALGSPIEKAMLGTGILDFVSP